MRIPFMTPRFGAAKDVKTDAEFINEVEKYVLKLRDFYDSRARWHRRFYRLSTVFIILLGAALPLEAGLDYPYKEVLLSISGVVIAALTALRAFYHWDQFWVLHRNTEMTITQCYLRWKASSVGPSNDDDSVIEARKKTILNLVEEIIKIREDEAGSFFKALSDRQGVS